MGRKEAKQRGEPYYDGAPCTHCGGTLRRTINKNCVPCSRRKAREYNKNNPEKRRQNAKTYYNKNSDAVKRRNKIYYKKNAEKIKKDSLSWYYSNLEQAKKNKKEWNTKNLAAKKYSNSLRRKNCVLATPEWVDKKSIREIYESCPAGYHVDHIVPLKGTRNGEHVVCGLHVPWNLQYLTAKENLKKNCRNWE